MDICGRVVFIAGPEIAAALRARLAEDRRVVVFPDSDSLAAFEVVLTEAPAVIALDPPFAATSRGASLIMRVRAAPENIATEIRLLSTEDGADFARRLRELENSPAAVIATLSRPLEWCGTRRALRFAITAEAPAAIDGEPTLLVNLSATGVQLVSTERLRPAQGFRLTLSDEEGEARLDAVVAWSRFETSGEAPAYRAGAEFVGSDRAIIEAYCKRYGTSLDPISVAPSGGPHDAPPQASKSRPRTRTAKRGSRRQTPA